MVSKNKNQINKKTGQLSKPITIFATKKGVNVVKSPVKSLILNALNEKDLSFDEIVKIAGKSKSTVSAHLKSLTRDSVIGSRTHPHDQRKKIFFINSRYIGDMNPQEAIEREEQKVEFLIQNLIDQGNPFEFFRLMFHTLRVELIQEGINIDPLLHQAGIRIGQSFYQKLQDPDMDKMLQNLADFWQANGLGTIEVFNKEPLVIRAYDCFECELLPKTGESACALDSGILEALFSGHFAKPMVVEETKCYAKGDDYCCFVIGPDEE
ncbi:V4R domain-containing protein [Methanobacterium alcaliphilum]|uniref:V4R domain-containing protein n=1 Tax=Methanobacterium alcaliphilum TaxID=392018 RepID=UPI002009E730|nr:ArsR family transcriptional regulator [Methanobacterium alcaliphilum]